MNHFFGLFSGNLYYVDLSLKFFEGYYLLFYFFKVFSNHSTTNDKEF